MCTTYASGLHLPEVTSLSSIYFDTVLNSIYFDTVTCPPLTLPNGTIRYNTPQLEDGRFWVNTAPRFSCNSGYEFNGVSWTTCQNSGEWRDELPICEGN